MQDGRISHIPIRQRIAVGSILEGMFDERDDVTPKNGEKQRLKRFLIIGEDENGNYLALLLINSKPRTGSKEIDQLQYPLSPLKHVKLVNHHSFIDCSKVRERHIDDVAEFIEKGRGRLIEKLDEEEVDIIRNTVANAKTISAYKKKKYGLF